MGLHPVCFGVPRPGARCLLSGGFRKLAYDPVNQTLSADCSHNVAYLDRIMRKFDMGDRWIYRNEADGTYHGVAGEAEAEKILASTDVMANVSGACWLRPVTAAVKTKLFLDGDPMFTQTKLNATKPEYLERVLAHDRHYSFGLNIGQPGCKVPTAGLWWLHRPADRSGPLEAVRPGRFQVGRRRRLDDRHELGQLQAGGIRRGNLRPEGSRISAFPGSALPDDRALRLAMGQGPGKTARPNASNPSAGKSSSRTTTFPTTPATTTSSPTAKPSGALRKTAT